MAAKIRLKKVGRKGQPSYRVVVLDGRKPRDAKVVADLGHYDPKTDPATFEIDNELALKWLLEGAKATKAARDILSRSGAMAAWDAARRGVEPPAEETQAPKKARKAEAEPAPEKSPKAKAEDDAEPKAEKKAAKAKAEPAPEPEAEGDGEDEKEAEA